LASAVSRGSSTYDHETYQYDTWGNQTYVLSDKFSNGNEQENEQWSWYLNSGSTIPSVWNFPDLGADESLSSSNVHDLLKGEVVRAYRPSQAGGGVDEKDQEMVYNAYGFKKAEGLWLGNHWATTSYTYFTDPTQLSAGSPQTRTGPNPGQVTSWSYDYASYPQSMYIVTETTQNVADPAGTTASLVSETAYDWESGWKLYDKDAQGYITEYSYDKLNRPTDTLKPGDESSLSAGSWSVIHTSAPWEHYAYDDTALTVTVSKGSYPSGTMKIYEMDSYDSLGQLIRIDKYNSLGPSGGQLITLSPTQTVTTKAGYDPWGDVTSMTDPNGNTTQYAYDARGRVSLVTHADGTKITTVYDDTQNLKTTTNERGVVTQEWLTWKDQSLIKVEDVGNLNLTTQTYYDGQDQMVAQTDPLSLREAQRCPPSESEHMAEPESVPCDGGGRLHDHLRYTRRPVHLRRCGTAGEGAVGVPGSLARDRPNLRQCREDHQDECRNSRRRYTGRVELVRRRREPRETRRRLHGGQDKNQPS
jgi:YD repeat-containing protein